MSLKIQAGPFCGAKVFLNPSSEKRKIFGLYEHVLNDWIKEKSNDKRFVLDIGANTGYHTYGFAHLLLKNKINNPTVFAFDPEAHSIPELNIPKDWPEYRKCDIRIIPKFVGNTDTENQVSLDQFSLSYPAILEGNGLVKIDVEGAESAVLAGAKTLLQDPRNDWLIEIHGKERITEIAEYFVELKRPFLIKDLVPLRWLRKERRTVSTYWLLTL